jgi:threonine dehydratase
MAETVRAPAAAGAEAALARIRAVVPESPLLHSAPLSKALGMDLWFKCELFNATFSFKLRGATNDLRAAKESGRLKGAIVCSSSGNHGLACAWTGKDMGVPCHVFVSEAVGPAKRQVIQALGGTVHVAGRDIDDARAAAIDYAQAHGHYFVNDGVSPEIMEGAGTMALEVVRRLPDVDAILTPVGGGNLAAGTSLVLKSVSPKTKAIAVAPSLSPVIVRSFHEKTMLSIPPGDSVADGLTQREPILETMRVIWQNLDDAWLVEDEAILAAMHALMESAHVLVEPSGAAGLAAAWAYRDRLKGKRVVVPLTGSNVNPGQLRRALAVPSLAPLG